jgi:hypothetical protein
VTRAVVSSLSQTIPMPAVHVLLEWALRSGTLASLPKSNCAGEFESTGVGSPER